ncbi:MULTISPECIES: c-type cytochrome domain-containing protein [unclassified Sphingobium]|uniref:c-type cytochrome domain-containing protein n=1 Tax=unclassified Sphingobium TaxID=2611147 RepID=UPI0022244433|nr:MULTISPECIES: c-type cytochrome domain-containing protein [unclassified Sphingobium]MCW2349314.1 putative membrane protein [Sphingobium sp. B12D2B]MCW2368416.1 putative membrane protein [Sphingobium sp. B11D3D]
MQDFIFFLGRFHVLVLHLPIGILMLAIGLEIATRWPRFAALRPAVPATWLIGALCAFLTVTLGYMHASEPGFTGEAVNWHRWSGVLLAASALLVWAWQREFPNIYDRGWPLACLITGGLLVATGHFGGNLTHGPTYLTEFAPGPLRSGPGGRPPVTNVADADIFLDVVHPTLQTRCASCHNDDKRRGALSMATYKSLMEGGESGAVIDPGEKQRSDLYRRITLRADHKDFMPKNGRTPLTPDEVAVIGWWIEAGALPEGTVGKLNAPEDIRAKIAKVLGL